MISAGDLGFAQPAEWAPHAACWVAWPCAEDLWGENLGPARRAWVTMARAIGDSGSARSSRPALGAERLVVLVPDEAQERLAKDALAGLDVRFHRVPFGDIWMRDIAPIFLRNARGEVATARFAFNGWGGKYVLPGDDRVAERVAKLAGLREFAARWVLEGGSLDVDGEGTCLTTRQCLLNPNRNPTMDQRAVEQALAESLGLRTTVWLGDGLANDHTDGHVDNIARFVAPGVALCMEPSGADDPNREALEAIARDLAAAKDARGRKLEVVRIPSPGRVVDGEGRVVPASFANFYIGNRAVIVPTYATPWDDPAVEKIAALFPGRSTVGVDARAILTGGGAFHCITQQEPKAGA